MEGRINRWWGSYRSSHFPVGTHVWPRASIELLRARTTREWLDLLEGTYRFASSCPFCFLFQYNVYIKNNVYTIAKAYFDSLCLILSHIISINSSSITEKCVNSWQFRQSKFSFSIIKNKNKNSIIAFNFFSFLLFY